MWSEAIAGWESGTAGAMSMSSRNIVGGVPVRVGGLAMIAGQPCAEEVMVALYVIVEEGVAALNSPRSGSTRACAQYGPRWVSPLMTK